MTTTPKVLLKRSSVAGRIPSDSDLDYGELAINFADGKLYYKNNSNQIKAFIDSARVQEIADAVEVVAQAQLDSSEVTDLIDSAYVQALVPLSYLEGLIDSAYINARSDHYTGFDSDFGTKTTDNLTEGSTNLYYTKARADSDIAASLSDSGNTVAITINNTILDTVDSAYVLARVNDAPFLDSYYTTALIDSAYIRARQEDLQRDSAFITNIVTNDYIQSAADSDYIKTVGGIDADKLDGQHGNYYLDWNNTTNKPTILDLVDVSTQITADVDKAFVDALNVDADTLDGQQGTYYLDYNNFTNTPAIQDSADVVGIVDSAYVRARVRTNQDLYTTSTVTFNQINGPENFIIDPATVGDNTGTVQILGNLQVEGTQTTINSTTVSINDKNIVLADSAANAAAADGAGITINGANATMQYSASGDKFVFNKPIEGEYLGFDSDFGTKTTDDLTEGSTNLYYTTARHNSDTLAQVDSAYIQARLDSAYISTVYDQSLNTTDDVIFNTVQAPVTFRAKNDAGSTLNVGEVVYIKGVDGNTPTVDRADADDANKMPAFGIVAVAANNQANVEIVTFGALQGVNTTGYDLGQTVYVSTTPGQFTNDKPSGASSLIQNIGQVVRVASNGIIRVGGAGRTNATPNLDAGQIFYGSDSNYSVATDLTSVVDSAYVRARVRTDQDLRTTDSVTFGGIAITDNRIHWGESDAYMEYLPDSDMISFNKPVKGEQVQFTGATIQSDSGTFNGLYVYDNRYGQKDWVARFSRRQNEFNSPAVVLISTDAEQRSDLAFEIRGNQNSNLLGPEFDDDFHDDDNTTFAIYGSGHTLIGYSNLPGGSGAQYPYSMLAGDNNVKLQVNYGISVDEHLVFHEGNYQTYIDSAYILARSPAGIDSDLVIQIIDSAYVEARAPAGATAAPFTQEHFIYTATSNQTVFTGADDNGNVLSYTNGKINVYLNGLLLIDSDDYTQTNNTVTLTSGATAGHVIDIHKMSGNNIGLDSAQVLAITGSGVDSVATQAMIDSNFLNRSGHLIPALDSTYDIGTASKKWKDLYLSGNTIYLGGHNIHRQGNAMRFIDSNGALIDLVAANLIDSNTVTTIIDSAYIEARSSGVGGAGTLDSALTSQLVDSAYVKLRVDYNGNEKLTFGNDQSQPGTLTATSTQIHSHGAGQHPPNSQFPSSYDYANGGIPIGQWVYAYYTFGNSAVGYAQILSKVDNGASAGTYTYYTTYLNWANGWTNVVVLANNIGQRDKGMTIQHETNADEIQFTSFRNFHFTQNDSDGRNFKIELVGDSASLELVGGKNIHYGSRYDHAGQFPDASIYTGMIAYSAANNSLYYANDSGNWQVIEGTGDPTFDDSNFIEQMIDSAYILGKKFVPGDAERRIDIRSTEPITQHALGDYWLDRDNEILYKLSQANNWTSAFPAYTYTGYPNMSTFDFGSHTTTASTSFNISGGPTGTFTATWKTGGTTGNYTGFEATFNNPVIFGYYYIGNTVAGWVHRVDYEDGSYAASNQSSARNQPDSITWYEADGTAMSGADAKTFSVPNSGGQTQNWLHPRGEKAVSLVYGRGTYGTRNYDAYLFFNGDNFYQRVGEIYDSGDIKALIDSNYITQYSGSGSGTVDSAATITLINAALDSAAVPFTQTFFHFTADSGQLTFSGLDDDSETLSYTANALAVYLNGILLVDSADYTATDGSSIVLFDSASLGDVLSVLKFQGNSNAVGGTGTIDSAYFQNVTGDIIPALDSTYDLGSTTKKWKELHLSGNTIFLGGHRIRKTGSAIAFTDSAGSIIDVTASNIPDAEAVFNVVNNGSSAYTFSGDGFSSSRDNPTLYLQRGLTYKFSVNSVSHPFQIRSSSGGSAYNNGVTNNGADEGDVYFTPDMNAPKNLVYQCTVHSSMVGSIVIVDNNSFLDSAATTALVDSAYIQLRDRFQEDSNFVTNIVDSSYIQARVTASTNIDSIGAIGNVNAIGATEGQILKFDSASQKFILASDATGGGGGGSGTVDSAQTISLIEATVDSDYIGTKVDFTRGEFVNEKSQYTATAAQTVFSHSSIDPTHLDVYLNGILQVVNDDYTATSSAVTFTSGVDSGYSVTIVEKRGRVLTNRGLVESKYYFTTSTPTTSITGTDDNGITLDYSDGFLDVYLNGILLKDSDDYSTNAGTAVTLVSATDSNDIVTLINRKGIVVTPNVKNYEFTATANQTTFTGSDVNGNTLSYVPGAIQVYLNGILLRNIDYTASTGSSIVLATSANVNDELVVSAFSNPGHNMDLYKFTADSGQTIFNGNDTAGASLAYQPGNIQVFMNGLLLNDSDDYTANNGMSVVLTSGADASDEIKIASFVQNADNIRTNAWSAPTDSTVSASAGDKLFIDVSSSAKTVTLPASASMGDEIRIIDVTGNAATNNITVARNGHNIQGSGSDLTININRAGIGLVYYNTTQGWVLIEN